MFVWNSVAFSMIQWKLKVYYYSTKALPSFIPYNTVVFACLFLTITSYDRDNGYHSTSTLPSSVVTVLKSIKRGDEVNYNTAFLILPCS